MPRKPSLESRALALLEDALDLPSAERDAFIARETEDDYALRARMMQLMAAATGDLDLLQTGGAPLDQAPTQPPETVGAYRIIETLGQGGMGAVYKARREAGDFDHVVAIKLIRPGALSAALVDRFKQERQILAELSHPNIARLFDGGTTPGGEPFIVMEYVDGLPIDRWAADRHLPLAARLRLFLAVCDAVRFAHQNLIVHRDITPPNVLVTPEGAVKLIDFGISRPPEAEGPVSTSANTATGQSLTPGFAAPERMTGAGATTLTDIYSLGRLLAVLTEGTADPDLGAIVAEATADDPQARYASVDALMDDVERFRDGRTVAARRGGRAYAVRKFVGRYRWPVGLSAAALSLIVAALVAALVSFAGAERARAAEAERFGQVRTLAGYMLFELNDDLARVPGNTAARAALAAKAQGYLKALSESRNPDPHLRLETARGLVQLAKIQGVPPEPNLAERKAARANLETAIGMLRALTAEARLPAAETAPDLARALLYKGLIVTLADTDMKPGKALIGEAEKILDAVPAGQRTPDWFLVQGLLRKAQAEVRYLDMDDPGVARAADDMTAELKTWPRALRESRAGAEHAALAEFYRATSQSAVGKGDFGIPAMLRAKAALTNFNTRWPGDPGILYALTYVDYMLFESAARAGQDVLSSQAIADAQGSVAVLLTLEENDNALKTLSVNIGQAYAQDLANRKQFPEAVAVQQAAIQTVAKRLTPERRAVTLADLAYAEMMLGLIGRKASDRTLACGAWTRADALFTEAAGKQPLTGFHQGFVAGLKTNLRLCAQGRPLSAFVALRE